MKSTAQLDSLNTAFEHAIARLEADKQVREYNQIGLYLLIVTYRSA